MTTPDHIMPPITDHGPLETMARKLAPCPFCGSDEFLMLSNSLLGVHSFWQVECGCHASGAPEILRENAIKVWNTRSAPDGYAIVPVEPTEAMLAAGQLEAEGCTNDWTASAACLSGHVWSAMLAMSATPIDSEKGE